MPCAVAQNWRLLAEEVTKRRIDLGMTQQDVQAAGGPAQSTLRHIEGAHQDTYRKVVLRRLEKALAWEAGSVDAILAGGEPTVSASPVLAVPSVARVAAVTRVTNVGDRQPARTKTLGEVLVERGLRKADELGLSDEIEDPLVEELLAAEEFDDEFKNRWLSAYATMRHQIFEGVREEKRKLRG